MKAVTGAVAAALLLATIAGCKRAVSEPPRQTLTVLAATSLGNTLGDVAKSFEQKNPQVRVNIELASSRKTCLKVAEHQLPADLVFTADAELIDAILVPEAADFSMAFAQNALVLAYAAEGPLAHLLRNGTPWQEILAEGKYRVGTANPANSPVGYRALLALKLNDLTAPEHLRLGRRIAAKLQPDHRRSDVSHLVSALNDRDLDAAFIYRSEALQHDLAFVSLNHHIDFSDPRLRDEYAQASLSLPGSEETIFGTTALYGLTILRGAKEPALAARFVSHLMSAQGRAQARRHSLPLLPAENVVMRGQPQQELLAESPL